ncbi:MATE family efflux transporter [Aliiroseovarius sp. PTFE2010]|uniref:MATE family efflux transporter n=1 Tax=Aliiroseovarius sp. PTFE2010 TaxID=3417190 RepID=UPI003CF4C353
MVLSSATVPILGAVDTGVVGQIGTPEPIGAVGLGAMILTSIYWVFGFLRMGTTGLSSQALGRGDLAEVSMLLTRALMVAAIAGGAFIVLQWLWIPLTLALSPASPAVEDLTHAYMQIRIWSSPAAIAVYGLTGWLVAQERTRQILVIQLAMNGLNILLDLWFVLGLGWGVQGVAIATFLAEWSGAALGLWMCRDAFQRPDWRDWARVLDRTRLIQIARVNSDIMIRSMLLQAVFLSFTLFGSKLGDVQLAANQVLMQFLMITSYSLDGFAFASEALVGQAFGAGAVARLRRSVQLCGIWSGGTAVMLALAFMIFGPGIIDVMTTADGVRASARDYLPWMVAAPIVGFASWLLDGVFIGATRSRDMRNMMLISVAVYGAVLAIALPVFGNHGLWAALLIWFVVRAVTLGLRYPALERAALD